MLVQAEVRYHLLELAVLVVELFEPAELANAKTAIQLLLTVKRLLGNPHVADHFRYRCARLCLLQCVGDLLFGIATLLHGMLLQDEGLITGNLSLKPEEETGATSRMTAPINKATFA